MSRVKRAVQTTPTTSPTPTTPEPATPSTGHHVCSSCASTFAGREIQHVRNIGVASSVWRCPKCGTDNVIKAAIDYPPEPSPTPAGVYAAARSEVAGAFDVEPDTVTVSWGEEKFFPDPSDRYSSFVAGMVIVKTPVRPGETVVQAGERAYAAAKQIGEKNRRDKWQEYMSVLREIRTGVKGS